MNRRIKKKKLKLKYNLDNANPFLPHYRPLLKTYSDLRKQLTHWNNQMQLNKKLYEKRLYDCHNKFTAKLYENKNL
jgi:transposase